MQENNHLEQINTIQGRSFFGRLRGYAKLTSPGCLQAAVTLGGGSLAGALDLGAIAGYYGSTQTTRTTNYRRVQDKDGYTELYDYRQPNAESTNLATHQPETVSELQKQPKARTKIEIK